MEWHEACKKGHGFLVMRGGWTWQKLGGGDACHRLLREIRSARMRNEVRSE